MDIAKLTDKQTVRREEAATRLHVIGDEREIEIELTW
jgi:hypothetical protein